jgi:hypothetical protein
MTSDLPQPNDELIYPHQISRDSLYALFVSAYMNVQLDDDGDIYLQDRFKSWVFPQTNGTQIRIMSQFRASELATREAKLEYVNLINDKLKLLRAYVDSDEDIGFDYFIPVEGGITKRNIVIAVRTAVDYIRTALERDEGDVIA